MKSIAISTDFIRANTLHLLILTLTLMLLPHVTRFPVWVSVAVGSLLGWRLLALRFGWRMPNRWIVAVLTLVIAVGLFLNYRTLLGRDVGVAALILMLVMKTLELRTLRDVMVVVFLSYFLVVTGFLYSQSVLMAIYLLATVVLMMAVLIDLNRLVLSATSQAVLKIWTNNIKASGEILLQAIPLMILLFILFPRISGPLWALPEDAKIARSGLSDSMSPGTINQLILSDDIAFRVRFDGDPPPPSRRYWRGPVLWYTDGKTWYMSNPDEISPQQLKSLSYTLAEDLFSYEITLEPHDKRWIFALDLPATIPEGVLPMSDFHLMSTANISDRKRYRLSSYTRYNTGPLEAEEKIRSLQLPENKHPKTRELAAQWRLEGSDEKIVQKALKHFRNENFVYTLLPRLLSGDTTDQFLFETREGFCEHYASAFVTLMRAAGIPARVVTGYLGGELNQFGDYMTVYQSDAHAWAEVWLNKKGWVRIDPTAAIAPERVRSRIDNSALRSGSVLYESDIFWLRNTWHTLRTGFDALNQYWNEWIIDYDEIRQADFLSLLGMRQSDYKKMGIVLVVLFMSFLAVIAVFMFVQKPKETDPVKKTYRKFLKKLAHKGINKQPDEGPGDFMKRVVKLFPDKSERITIISMLYIQLRYSAEFSENRVIELKKQVQVFKV